MTTHDRPDRAVIVHVPDAVHAAAKDFCKANGIRMNKWVSKLIKQAAKEVKRP